MAGCAATNVNQGRYASLTSQRDSLFLKISGAMYCGEIDSGQKYVRTARSRRTYAGGTTDLRQEVELLIIHNPAETKVCNHDVCILVLRAEQQILGLEIYAGYRGIRTTGSTQWWLRTTNRDVQYHTHGCT